MNEHYSRMNSLPIKSFCLSFKLKKKNFYVISKLYGCIVRYRRNIHNKNIVNFVMCISEWNECTKEKRNWR